MQINLIAVLIGAVLSMVLGFVWYGPLFGKTWMRIIGATAKDKEERAKMQKEAGPLYLIQFILSIIQVYILAGINTGLTLSQGLHNALLVYLGFVIPLVAAGAMWTNDSRKVMGMRFALQAGYYLVLFIIFAVVIAVLQ